LINIFSGIIADGLKHSKESPDETSLLDSIIDANLYYPENYDGNKRISNDASFLTPLGVSLVSNDDHVASPRYKTAINVSEPPVCFKRAVIGSGNRCIFEYCENHLPSRHVVLFREWAVGYHDLLRKGNLSRHSLRELARNILKNPPETVFDKKIVIGLMNRKVSREIVNMKELAFAIRQWDPRISVRNLDLDAGLTTAESIAMFRDISILIGPHGNGLGNMIWMPSHAAVISVNGRHNGMDWWFPIPTILSHKRFFSWDCRHDECVVVDMALAKKINQDANFGLEPDILERLARLNFTDADNPQHPKFKELGTFKGRMIKETSRKVVISEMMQLVKEIVRDIRDVSLSAMPFEEFCQHATCCYPPGADCNQILRYSFS
jgi:hypothetical protein